MGLSGHSDADVLVHAVCDAILGALAAGDIGRHFPDSDPSLKDISSLRLLERVRIIATERGYCVHNVDTTVVLEEPRLSAYIPEMTLTLSDVLGVPASHISIKAKTNEGMGFAGRREGVVAYAVVTIHEKEEK
jgi:2-C-methyl-D-erythritol 2,4-cyclodiphosphate synthase